MPRFFSTLKTFTEVATLAAYGGLLLFYANMQYLPKSLYDLHECLRISQKIYYHEKYV